MGVRVRVGHDTGGRVLVRIALLRVPGLGALWLRGTLTPDQATAVAGGLTKHAALDGAPALLRAREHAQRDVDNARRSLEAALARLSPDHNPDDDQELL